MDACKLIAVVHFPSGYKDYHFKNHIEDLSVGDSVVCDTQNGLVVGKVTGFKGASALASKNLVQKVDMEAHTARMEKQKKVDALRAKMEKRRKEIQDIQVYELLAQSDPDMAKLLNELTVLEGK